MKATDQITLAEAFAAKKRRLDMQHLNALEGNPLDAEDIAMFEMFERERWTPERRQAFIREQALKDAAPQAAE